jgi:hypothetical protein
MNGLNFSLVLAGISLVLFFIFRKNETLKMVFLASFIFCFGIELPVIFVLIAKYFLSA